MLIRFATPDDIPALHALEAACFPDPWSERFLRATLSEKNTIMLVAETDGQVAGYLNASTLLDESELNRICLLPQYRRQGLAQGLMARYEESCKERNVTTLFLEVRKSNAPARALYEKTGYLVIGERANYYTNPEEPAVLMRKLLAY